MASDAIPVTVVGGWGPCGEKVRRVKSDGVFEAQEGQCVTGKED